jgi:branched-chain amino acid transport system substrate-binding protein
MKGLNWVAALAATYVTTCVTWSTAQAEISDDMVRVGVLNDISGIFQDTNGMGSVEAARMAAEDFNGGGKNIKVEIIYADHQNKADVGSAIARKWLEVDKVDAIVDVPNSAVGLTINSLLRDSRMTFLASSTASSDLTGKACSPNTIQWVNDVWATGNATAAAMMERGGKDWYFITVNFALGQGIEAEATNYIEKHDGKVLGSAKHPLGTSDFASLLLQAQGSKAKIIGLANAGGDTINAVKQASEFGIQSGGQSLVAFVLFINDVHGMGLKVAQGLQLLEAFYWDMNDDTRAFAKRFAGRPGMRQDAQRQPGRRLCLDAGLSQRGGGNRQRRCQNRRARNEEVQGQGPTVRRCRDPSGRPRHPSDVPVRSEEARRVEISLRLLPAGLHHSRRSGVPADGGWRLPNGQMTGHTALPAAAASVRPGEAGLPLLAHWWEPARSTRVLLHAKGHIRNSHKVYYGIFLSIAVSDS